MGSRAERQERAKQRAAKSLEERRADAPKATSIDGGFTNGDGPAGIFGGAAKAEKT